MERLVRRSLSQTASPNSQMRDDTRRNRQEAQVECDAKHRMGAGATAGTRQRQGQSRSGQKAANAKDIGN